MTVNPAVAPQPRKLSISSLLSFICGLLFCIPLAGALAVLLGIIGFIRTANPFKKGRWMAVVGTILGLVSSVAWILFSATFIGMFYAVFALTQPPVDATRDFIKGLSENDAALVEKHNGGFSEEQLDTFRDYIHEQGKFIETTFPVRNVQNSTAEVTGTAKFEKSTQTVEARLEKTGADWKVNKLKIQPIK